MAPQKCSFAVTRNFCERIRRGRERRLDLIWTLYSGTGGSHLLGWKFFLVS
jgi:hypothetical protein